MFDLEHYVVDEVGEPEQAGYISIPLILKPYIQTYLKENYIEALDQYDALGSAPDNLVMPDWFEVEEHKARYCAFEEHCIAIDPMTELQKLTHALVECNIPFFVSIYYNDAMQIFYAFRLNEGMRNLIRYDSTLNMFDPRDTTFNKAKQVQWTKTADHVLKTDWNWLYTHMLKLVPAAQLAQTIEPLHYLELDQ